MLELIFNLIFLLLILDNCCYMYMFVVCNFPFSLCIVLQFYYSYNLSYTYFIITLRLSSSAPNLHLILEHGLTVVTKIHVRFSEATQFTRSTLPHTPLPY